MEVPKTHIEQDVISSVAPDGELFYSPFPGTMMAPKFITFWSRWWPKPRRTSWCLPIATPLMRPKRFEQWLADRTGAIELHGLPRGAPAYNPDKFLNTDLKQELANEPMLASTSEMRDTIGTILDRIASMSDRIRGYFKQAEIDLALN